MTKNVLLLAGAAMTFGMAFAQAETNNASTPEVYYEQVITAISPNGKYAASSVGFYGMMSLINRETGEIEMSFPGEDESDYYAGGYGCIVSNNGIMLGSTNESQDNAAYYENGEWHLLPIKDIDEGVCLSHGISADGKRIIGQVGRSSWGLETEGIMQQPVIWVRNAEDTGYDDYIELPFPKKDMFGLNPQYVTGICISADGKRALGQLVSGNGFLIEPVVYTEGEDGTWTYEIVHPELFINPDVEIPEAPGESPEYPNIMDYASAEAQAAYNQAEDEYVEYYSHRPEQADFMSPEEKEAYNAALQAYFNGLSDVYPYIDDFMTSEELEAYQNADDEFNANAPEYPKLQSYMSEEELKAYNDAKEKYDADYAKWYAAYSAYNDAIDEASAGAPTFEFNVMWLSGNGRYFVMTDSFRDWISGTSGAVPYAFDLETGEYYRLPAEESAMATCITDSGALLACTPYDAYAIRQTLVCPDLKEGTFVTIEEYIQPLNQPLYSWMNDNMRHTYPTYYWDMDLDQEVMVEVVDGWCTGTSTATPDFKFIGSWEMNQWDFEEDEEGNIPPYFFSYVLPLEYGLESVNKVGVKGMAVKALNGGVLELANTAAVAVYDVNGRLVYSNNAPAATVATGLSNGLYIVKATDAKGQIVVKKVAF